MASQNRVARNAENPFRVFIAGGCYAGLAAAINLLDACDKSPDTTIPVDITIVDERDGFCMPRQSPPPTVPRSWAS